MALAPRSPKLGPHPRCTGTPRGTSGLVVLDGARAPGSSRRGLQVPAGCATRPGERGGAAGPLNLQGRSEGCSRDGATRGPRSVRRRRRRGAPGRCVLDPFLPRRRLVSRSRGLAGCGLQAPTQAGTGLKFQQELALHWGAVVAWLPVCSRPTPGPDSLLHPKPSLVWPFDRPNCGLTSSPAPSGKGGDSLSRFYDPSMGSRAGPRHLGGTRRPGVNTRGWPATFWCGLRPTYGRSEPWWELAIWQ